MYYYLFQGIFGHNIHNHHLLYNNHNHHLPRHHHNHHCAYYEHHPRIFIIFFIIRICYVGIRNGQIKLIISSILIIFIFQLLYDISILIKLNEKILKTKSFITNLTNV